MSKKMKAVIMTDTGSVDGLQFVDFAEPEISKAIEVKIKIKVAGVNPIDTKIRQNGTFYQQALPVILGCDGAGEIVSMGSEVANFKVGDEVWFCHGGLGKEQGNYAEYNVIDSRWIALKPKNITFKEAAAMPLGLITAWGALFDKGRLQKGETVLIHAGAGGVGHLAIQLAKIKGATVIATVSSDEKADFAHFLGADYTVNYTKSGFIDEVNSIAKNGVDLVIDTVGSQVFKDSIAVMAYCGRLITLLDPGELSLAEARMKNLLIGFELMLAPLLKNMNVARAKQVEMLNQCAEWIDQGFLKVHVSEVFTLQDALKAHSKIEQGHTIGKIVLEIG